MRFYSTDHSNVWSAVRSRMVGNFFASRDHIGGRGRRCQIELLFPSVLQKEEREELLTCQTVVGKSNKMEEGRAEVGQRTS